MHHLSCAPAAMDSGAALFFFVPLFSLCSAFDFVYWILLHKSKERENLDGESVIPGCGGIFDVLSSDIRKNGSGQLY